MNLDAFYASLGRQRALPLAVIGAAALTAVPLAPTSNGPVTCLLRIHVGQACPLCGMSRATGRLLQGDLVGAAAYHPFVLALIIQAVGFAIWRYWWGSRPMEPRHHQRILWSLSANMALLFVVWLIRIRTGHIYNTF